EVSAAWDDVREGQAAGFLISGEAGVGKTRLVQECVERVLAEGGQVLAGSSFRISSGGLPYGPILDALRRLLRERSAESPTALAELLRGPFMNHLPLGPLGAGDLGLLLAHQAGNPLPSAVVDEIADRSGGNAFFAEELLEARGLGHEVPARVRDVVLLRVA